MVKAMARRPRIGTRIRRAMERRRMDQVQLAEELGVSRSAVNAWINDRAYPQNSVGALEEILGVDLSGDDLDVVIRLFRELSPEDQGRVLDTLTRRGGGAAAEDPDPE